MSDYQQKPGSGVIFKNEKAEGQQPLYKGKGLDLEGNEIEIALWVKESKGGNKYFSFRIQYPKPKDQPKAAPQPKQDDDDLPF
jgi:hypothetical protein